ncbi:MAG: ATP-binding protein [bacterium]|nr:ATP-binding protein [bacterium]
MEDEIEAADFVLVVCTETYLRRFRAQEELDRGLGATWEGGVISMELYEAQGRNTKFVPVFWAAEDAGYVPRPLRHTTYYRLDGEEGYEKLYARLTAQSRIRKRELGHRRAVEPRAAELRFDLKKKISDARNDLRGVSRRKGRLASQARSPLPRVGLCFGREAVVREIADHVLGADPRPVPVLGGPGIGKSTVSRAVLHDPAIADRFGERRYFVRCERSITAEETTFEIARVVGIDARAGDPDLRDLIVVELRPHRHSSGWMVTTRLRLPSKDLISIDPNKVKGNNPRTPIDPHTLGFGFSRSHCASAPWRAVLCSSASRRLTKETQATKPPSPSKPLVNGIQSV